MRERWVVTVEVPQRDGSRVREARAFEGFTCVEAQTVAVEMAARDEAARRDLDGVPSAEEDIARAIRVVSVEAGDA